MRDTWVRFKIYTALGGKITKILMSVLNLCCILDFECSRNQRQGSEFFSREGDFMRWFPVVSLNDGILKVTHEGIKLTIPVL